MDDAERLESLRKEKRLFDLRAKATGVSFEDVAPGGLPPLEEQDFNDPNVDYTQDLDSAKFRAAYSFMRGKRQKETFLNKTLGEGNWRYDASGNTIVEPAGLAKYGIKSEKARPLDKPMPSMTDLADYASIIPTTLGGVGASVAATGAGAIPGLALVALGSGAGQLLAEGGKAIAGYPATLGEAAQAVGSEALGGAVGEGTFRALRGLGKIALQPAKSFMTPEREALMKEAQARGFTPYPGQVTGSRIQQRVEGASKQIYGSQTEANNIARANESMDRLRSMAGPAVSKEEIGTMSRADLAAARSDFGKKFEKLYNEINYPTPTAPLVQQAQALLNKKVMTTEGEAINLDAPTEKFLSNITKLPATIPSGKMHELRTFFRKNAQPKNLAYTLDMHSFGLLREAADNSLTAAINSPVSSPTQRMMAQRLKDVDAAYREGINKFDINFLGNIAKHPREASAVDADKILEYAIQPESTVRARQFMENLTEPTRRAVRRGLADDLTSTLFTEGPDPFKRLMSGSNFLDALNKYSPETLKTVMGDDWVKEAYKTADVIRLVTSGKNSSGSLVVATAIMDPLRHLGTLGAYKILSKAMTDKMFLKWMTTGFANPTSKAGKAALSLMENSLRILSQTATGTEEASIPETE